jgi:hypothetical protein
MAELRLYLAEKDISTNDEAKNLLETAWLDYEEETTDFERPKLEVVYEDEEKLYVGLNEIREGLEDLDLSGFERRF